MLLLATLLVSNLWYSVTSLTTTEFVQMCRYESESCIVFIALAVYLVVVEYVY